MRTEVTEPAVAAAARALPVSDTRTRTRTHWHHDIISKLRRNTTQPSSTVTSKTYFSKAYFSAVLPRSDHGARMSLCQSRVSESAAWSEIIIKLLVVGWTQLWPGAS